EWDGRWVRQGPDSGVPTLGGEATHIHSISHLHAGISEKTLDTAQPLGLQRDLVAGASHTHAIKSLETSRGTSGSHSNLPPSIELIGVIAERSHTSVPSRVIVAYMGEHIPDGWVLC